MHEVLENGEKAWGTQEQQSRTHITLLGHIVQIIRRQLIRLEKPGLVSSCLRKGWITKVAYEYCLYSVPSPPFSRSTLKT
jgi:hypothetical protein